MPDIKAHDCIVTGTGTYAVVDPVIYVMADSRLSPTLPSVYLVLHRRDCPAIAGLSHDHEEVDYRNGAEFN